MANRFLWSPSPPCQLLAGCYGGGLTWHGLPICHKQVHNSCSKAETTARSVFEKMHSRAAVLPHKAACAWEIFWIAAIKTCQRVWERLCVDSMDLVTTPCETHNSHLIPLSFVFGSCRGDSCLLKTCFIVFLYFGIVLFLLPHVVGLWMFYPTFITSSCSEYFPNYCNSTLRKMQV